MENTRAKIEVRDQRGQDWVWTEKVILYSPLVSASDYKVYNGLAAHANNRDQSAWPSIETLAKKLNMGRSTVQRSLSNLERIRAILVERRAGMSSIYTLLKVDAAAFGKLPNEPMEKKESPYFAFIDFWEETALRLRKTRPIRTKADESQLGRILQKNIMSQDQLEQLAIYYLGSRRFLRFAPSMRTFFSAGILTGLMNDMQNKEDFWKELDNILIRYNQIAEDRQESPIKAISLDERGAMLNAMKELSAKLSVPRASDDGD